MWLERIKATPQRNAAHTSSTILITIPRMTYVALSKL